MPELACLESLLKTAKQQKEKCFLMRPQNVTNEWKSQIMVINIVAVHLQKKQASNTCGTQLSELRKMLENIGN